MNIRVNVPKGFKPQDVAECFSAYLLASGAFGRDVKDIGPQWVEPSDKWQLDSSNDYFLRVVDESAVLLSCRYFSQQPVLEAMAVLFKARYHVEITELISPFAPA